MEKPNPSLGGVLDPNNRFASLRIVNPLMSLVSQPVAQHGERTCFNLGLPDDIRAAALQQQMEMTDFRMVAPIRTYQTLNVY